MSWMEIVIDKALLKEFESSDAMQFINELFGEPVWATVPSASKTRGGKMDGVALQQQVSVKTLHYKERELILKARKKFFALSREELGGIAIAKNRGLIYIALEPQAREACKTMGVRYITLPMLMKALWAKKILTKRQVLELIGKIERNGKMKFGKIEQILGEM